jgi:hypothetical protein
VSNNVNIAAAGDVEVPAYLVLRAKGYDITVSMRGQGEETWHATKDGNRFSGEGPIELLGVVAVFEARGENWQAADSEIDDFIQRYDI